MSSSYRRQRGNDSQNAVAAMFARSGWQHAESAGSGRRGTDVTNVPGWAIEVKAWAGPKILAGLRQHQARKAMVALVLRLDGTGPATVERWPALMRLGQFLQLCREAQAWPSALGPSMPLSQQSHYLRQRSAETHEAVGTLLNEGYEQGWWHHALDGETTLIPLEYTARRQLDMGLWLRRHPPNKHTVPALVIRPDGIEPAWVTDWPVMTGLAELIRLMREAGYGDAGKPTHEGAAESQADANLRSDTPPGHGTGAAAD